MHRISIALLLLLVLAPSQAQLYVAPKDVLGGNTWEGCDPSLQVDFTDTLTDYLTYRFDPLVVPGVTIPFSHVWSYFDGDLVQVFEDTLTHTFPAPGEYPVCLTVNAFDQLAQQPCSTTTCRIGTVLQDPSCAGLTVDFSIAGVDGQTITFVDLSTLGAGTWLQQWTFGDGATAIGGQPSHTFPGSGPHEVCLTVVGPPPAECTSTICKWLYLGQAPVGCEVLLEPGFLLVQETNLVGVLDTSATSGMESSVEWSFGDGSMASGPWAIHAYDQGGAYELCSTIRMWGPLVADTCTTVNCTSVIIPEVVGVGEAVPAAGLSAHPVPFTDALWLQGLPVGPGRIDVHDARGRLVHQETISGAGVMYAQLGHLAPGVHMVRVHGTGGVRTVRILKE